MIRKTILVLVLVFGLSGCGSFLPIRNLDNVPQETKEAALSLPLVRSADLPPGSFDLLGPVEGHSCQNQLLDKPASKLDAELRMKVEAFELGARAILDATCNALGTNYGTNCWHSFSCSGHAVRPKTDETKPKGQQI